MQLEMLLFGTGYSVRIQRNKNPISFMIWNFLFRQLFDKKLTNLINCSNQKAPTGLIYYLKLNPIT
jgi:hypothetical protein